MLLQCPHCQTRNRVDELLFDHGATCGQCGKPLAGDVPIALNDENFASVLAASERPVVVDFWAGWCAPCKQFAPVFAAAAKKTQDVLFAKVDTDANSQTTSRYAIRSIPTIALFQRGQFVDRATGALSPQQLDTWLRAVLK